MTLDPAPAIAPRALPLFLDHAGGDRPWNTLGLPKSVVFRRLFLSSLERPEGDDALAPEMVCAR
jgi:hypothetical protein